MNCKKEGNRKKGNRKKRSRGKKETRIKVTEKETPPYVLILDDHI